MNVAVVRRATAGLAAWLRPGRATGRRSWSGATPGTAPTPSPRPPPRCSPGPGSPCTCCPRRCPTPVLAFAVRHLGAVAGVQITASHNPPADNGYKVYLADGAQLAPPSDAEIEAAITAAPPARSVPTAAAGRSTADVTEAYLDRVGRLPRGTARDLRIALTPMHGVGGATAVHALRAAGLHRRPRRARRRPRRIRRSRRSRSPTPRSPAPPTCCSRWPPTSAPTSRSRSTRTPTGARSAVPARWRRCSPATRPACCSATTSCAAAATPTRSSRRPSSRPRCCSAVAAAHGARYAETLTGFKWIVRGGPGLVYGYEEALGYCVDPDAVRDKDGIAAAVLACDLAATLKADGRGPARPARRAGPRARRARDRRGVGADGAGGARRRRRTAARAPRPRAGRPSARPRTCSCCAATGERLVVRPSGTEPKLKAYLEVVEPPDDDVAAARARAAVRMAALRDEVAGLWPGS